MLMPNIEDFMSTNNNRADMVEKLIAFCDEHNLSYEHTLFDFTVKLPGAEPIPTASQMNLNTKHARRKFDISNWGDTGIDETDPDNPDNFKLKEGE